MDIDPTMLFLSIVISAIGLGYYSVGKKKGIHFKIVGLMMMFYPYFVNNVWWVLGIGVGLVFLPYVLERFFPF